ncbi:MULTISPECIES: iron ABC transporter permease [unclassified Enterococcus]|uniref:FecCD family ABC transporter permease n=1 Tax=unclassified Enterococcus TaxID=2608891 RepID=UPI0015536EC0|nr:MULTISPECIES: iron ABC transporter permease [unclassified Enterococcus]MBS7578251.1 iron ABC transporter permease [Enterococcus sp. MMGLQ5-2]MBS7585510.1 iron ABC transporter permease [Enterococcus sp. MMGLQ5-1]NPD13369.1 iron ABC transporter permease [Enterococcus sp. MMGLQ5-1]NPD38082.1 iron ABC transporter permease [Enterococcus sp. MMGLQ5-2]
MKSLKIRIIFFIFAFFGLMLCFIWSLNTGSISLPLSKLLLEFFSDDPQVNIIKDLRLPRILIAMLSGAALTVSALLLQVVSKNDLAEAGFLGISASAEFAYLLVILTMPQLLHLNLLFSVLFSLAIALILFYLSRINHRHSNALIIFGVAINACFTGINQILNQFLSTSSQGTILNGLGQKTWAEVKVLGLIVGIGIIISILLSQWCNILRLPTVTLNSLGVPVAQYSAIFLVIAVALAATTVVVMGVISFLGLIVAHICRKLIGNDYRLLMPFGSLVGAIFLLLADTIGRSWFLPIEISANNILLMIGGLTLLIVFVNRGKAFEN